MIRGYWAALVVEARKAVRSPVAPLTGVVGSAAAGIGALFMFILLDPGRAERLGLLSQKARLSGLAADWTGMLTFVNQVVAVGGLLLYSFIATWVFAREAADGTMRYLLALPVSRQAIVAAKFTVVAVWSAAVTAWLTGLALLLGWALGLPGGGTGVLADGLAGTGRAAALMLLATTPVALVASAGRGYLAPLASALGALVLAQVAAALGWGGVVPWSVPAVAAGLAPGTGLGAPGVVVAVLTALTGVVGTLAWWRSGRAGG